MGRKGNGNEYCAHICSVMRTLLSYLTTMPLADFLVPVLRLRLCVSLQFIYCHIRFVMVFVVFIN